MKTPEEIKERRRKYEKRRRDMEIHGEGKNIPRQHPRLKNSLWCPSCKIYKKKEMFTKDNKESSGYKWICKECDNKKLRDFYKEHREVKNKKNKEWRCKNEERNKKSLREWYVRNKGKVQEKNKKNQRYRKYPILKVIDSMPDSRARALLKQQNLPATPEMIYLKKVLLAGKQTLKRFKKWREENESNGGNVYKEQCADGKADESHRWHKETGHGSDCGCTAGV